jgi:hypothetical protein
VRGTALPLPGVELQGSYARVASPEQREGFGLDQHKRNVSARLISADGGRYLLAEWARTVDRDHVATKDVLAYESALIEGAITLRAVSLALRFEQTERPRKSASPIPFASHARSSTSGSAASRDGAPPRSRSRCRRRSSDRFGGIHSSRAERTTARARDARSVFDAESPFYGSGSPGC